MVRLPGSWYKPDERVSFEQMQATLRCVVWTTLMKEGAEEEDIFGSFGYPQDSHERQQWILRLFFGC